MIMIRLCLRKSEILFLASVTVVLFLILGGWAREYSCINTVSQVNRELQAAGFNKTCPILQVTSAADCNARRQHDLVNSAQDFLDGQLDACSNYIKDTAVPFNDEEKDHPLAFSILAHKDASQFAKYNNRSVNLI